MDSLFSHALIREEPRADGLHEIHVLRNLLDPVLFYIRDERCHLHRQREDPHRKRLIGVLRCKWRPWTDSSGDVQVLAWPDSNLNRSPSVSDEVFPIYGRWFIDTRRFWEGSDEKRAMWQPRVRSKFPFSVHNPSPSKASHPSIKSGAWKSIN